MFAATKNYRCLLAATALAAWFFLLALSSNSQPVTLVDFGATQAENSYGLAGWDDLLLSDRMAYTSQGSGGVFLQSDFDIFTDYMGVRGAPRQFSRGERIVVIWYNSSDQVIRFNARISFDDPDNPNGGSVEGQWFTMRNAEDYRQGYCEAQPGGTVRTAFNIEESGVHKTDGTYELVNINLRIEWDETQLKQFIVCDRIELLDDADVVPPDAPANLNAMPLSDNAVRLQWEAPNDNTGTVEYNIYMNGELEGYSTVTSFDAGLLEPDTEYFFLVTALDHCRNESAPSTPATARTQYFRNEPGLINPGGFEYLGAVRLPEDAAWGGEALTYNPDGDGGQSGAGADDGHPGSVYTTDLNQPQRGFVGELSIPEPIITSEFEALNQATMLQDFVNIRPEGYTRMDYVDIWRNGLCYFRSGGVSDPVLYSAWGYHYEVNQDIFASVSACRADDLAGSARNGFWQFKEDGEEIYSVYFNDYLFKVPDSWADANTSGRSLITGRFRDGALTGLGPTLMALDPIDINTPPAPGSPIEFTRLLQFDSYEYQFDPDRHAIPGYTHDDHWQGADWISAGSQNAVLIVGNKGHGKYWYGYYGENMALEYIDGDIPMPDFYETDPDGKGWRAENLSPIIMLFSTDDLATVARGEMEPNEPQPYGALRLPKSIFFDPLCEIRSACYDPMNQFLYVTEFVLGHDGNLVLHVWHVDEMPVSVSAMFDRLPLLEAYPNPASGRFSVKLPEKSLTNLHYQIYNSSGEFVKSGSQAAGRQTLTLTLEKCVAGAYFIRIVIGKEVFGTVVRKE